MVKSVLRKHWLYLKKTIQLPTFLLFQPPIWKTDTCQSGKSSSSIWREEDDKIRDEATIYSNRPPNRWIYWFFPGKKTPGCWLVTTRNILPQGTNHLLRMVMEPKYYAFRRWLDTQSSSENLTIDAYCCAFLCYWVKVNPNHTLL